MLKAFNYLDEDIEFGRMEDELVSEATINEAFLQKNFSFDSDSESNSNSNSQIDSRLNFDNIDSDNSNSDNKNTSQYSCSNSHINSCNSSYAREKLIKILAREVAIAKQRWGINRILDILTYHQKDHQLRFSYYQFKQFAYQTLLLESKSLGKLPHALTSKD